MVFGAVQWCRLCGRRRKWHRLFWLCGGCRDSLTRLPVGEHAAFVEKKLLANPRRERYHDLN